MTLIGVISDTHLSSRDPVLDMIAATIFADVSIVLHAGDMVSPRVLDAFTEQGKNVIAVCGNMDGPDVRAAFPRNRVVRVEGVTIGLVHGWGGPQGIRPRVREVFDRVDAIVYGHTHQGFSGREGGFLFFNPGSPTDSRFTHTNSVGIMTVEGHHVEGKVLRL